MITQLPLLYNNNQLLSDPYYNNVILLCHFNGVDDGAVFTDEKGHTLTRFGTPVTKTAVKKFGSASGLFTGIGNYLKVNSAPEFNLNSSTVFTVEFWFKLDSLTGTVNTAFRIGNTVGRWQIIIRNNSIFVNSKNGNYFWGEGFDVTLDTNWHHLVFQRGGDGNTSKFFYDGFQQTISSNTYGAQNQGFNPLFDNNYDLYIGNPGSTPAVDSFPGYIEEMRITKDIERYSANFDVQNEEFPNF